MNFETIYQDIITNVLPKVQEGLVITKDYVFEFMGRYVTYLIIIDILTIVACIAGVIIEIVLVKKIWKWTEGFEETGYNDGNKEMTRAMSGVALVFSIGIIISTFFSTSADLIKTLTIPEVRIFEEYQEMKNKF